MATRMNQIAFLFALGVFAPPLVAETTWPVGPGAADEGTIQTALGLDPAKSLDIVTTPKLPVTYRDVEFPTEDGVVIFGRYAHTPLRNEAPVVVLLHQGLGAHHEFDGFDDFLLQSGFSTFAIDMRGYGQSTARTDGSTIDANEFLRDARTSVFTEMDKDVTAALDFLQGEGLLDTGRAILLGTYAGGAVAGKATGPNGSRVGCTVLVSTPQSFRQISLMEELGKIQGVPVLLIASEQDTEAGGSMRLISSANPNVIARRVRGGGVGMLLLDNEELRTEVLEFIRRHSR